ncbi:protein-glutamine gamma-glutamyltransferase [Mesobacillus maritimus]|uniref:protein-glutamine gamma-glutamyltransferase n=1 Tax=Mesobacillus maritimus TaxID=1643336 RepID=UPI00384B3DCA
MMIKIRIPGSISVQSLQGYQKDIYMEMEKSYELFEYFSSEELRFELWLRENTIKAAHDLNDSGASFTSFQYSNFNPAYWVRGSRGYLLRPDVVPSEAIRDIFMNGKMYGFECSTAMVIVFYKAVLDSIRNSAFNYLFNNLLVWNWNYDPDLQIITKRGEAYIPGDVIYFANPDYKEPIWIGANAVVLGRDQYYAHGIGIKTAAGMVAALNSLRKEGATRSAYLLKQHSRLNARYLFQFSNLPRN